MTVESADLKKRMAEHQRGTERAARFVVEVERLVSAARRLRNRLERLV